MTPLVYNNVFLLAAQLYLTLCYPAMDCRLYFHPSPPPLRGSSVQGILHARILEWVVLPSVGDLPNPEIESQSPS